MIDVEDVARGHILAAKKGRIGERYLFGNRNIAVSDYFNLIAEIAGVKPPSPSAFLTILLLRSAMSSNLALRSPKNRR